MPGERAAGRASRPAREPLNIEVRWFDSLDSTNRYLLDEARRGAPEGLVVVADHQTEGRGRRGRSWVAPPGASLLVSVLLRPALAPERTQLVSMACGVALAEAIERVAGFVPALKWPNDLVVGDRKLAGILAETDGDAVVVGAGVNVEWREFPPELAETATACNLESGRSVDRRALLSAFLKELDHRYADLDQLPGEYRRRLATLGRRVRVERPDGDVVGRAVGVGDSGELLVEPDSGDVVEVRVGDVVHLRAE
jgi:BirA family biotin operon repressor/biotin-[acetyl-CoA-carboxylase] ligase